VKVEEEAEKGNQHQGQEGTVDMDRTIVNNDTTNQRNNENETEARHRTELDRGRGRGRGTDTTRSESRTGQHNNNRTATRTRDTGKEAKTQTHRHRLTSQVRSLLWSLVVVLHLIVSSSSTAQPSHQRLITLSLCIPLIHCTALGECDDQIR
jgi:E3 ubiquitin-protein ligase DOA10